VAGSCDCGGEFSGSGATDLVMDHTRGVETRNAEHLSCKLSRPIVLLLDPGEVVRLEETQR
jgi:hypothetical protein